MKSKEISLFAISILILSPLIVAESFAQEEQNLTITTVKASYVAGESIEVEGVVESKVSDFKVTIRIFNPVNNLITIDELGVNNDGTFSGEIPTSIGGLWQKDGTYKIIANYYASQEAITQFEYGGMAQANVKDTTPEFSISDEKENNENIELIDFDGYDIGYELTGAKIIRITPDVEMKSLIIEIETFSDGELRITLPKDVIDTDEEGFFVLVDGIETKHDALSNSNNWSFVIPFYHGSEEIEIIGTYVIPEFGTVAALILVLSITTIVIISVKNKQIFYQKM